jgi:pyrroline-5-carboxylate reductase
MGYTLCVLGCGTMGIAVLSGVIASLDPQASLISHVGLHRKWEMHTPGTLTPVSEDPSTVDPSLPSRFLACVSREESAKRLRGTFSALGGLGSQIEVVVGDNLGAVEKADVVLLW